MAVGVYRKTISWCVRWKGKLEGFLAFSHTKASSHPSWPASEGWTRAPGGCCPGARGGGGAGCRMPQNKDTSRALLGGHLLPPGQIRKDWRGHLEEMVLFFGKSIRPTLNRAFCPPSLGVLGNGLPGLSITVLEEAAPLPAPVRSNSPCPTRISSALCRVWLPFSPSLGSPAPLYTQAPFIMRLEVELSPTPLLLRFLFSQWPGLHFTPAPCLPVSSGLGPFLFPFFQVPPPWELQEARPSRIWSPSNTAAPLRRKEEASSEWMAGKEVFNLSGAPKKKASGQRPSLTTFGSPQAFPVAAVTFPSQARSTGRMGGGVWTHSVVWGLLLQFRRTALSDSILWLFAGYRREKFGTWAGSESELSPWRSWFTVSLLMAKLSLSLGEMSPCCPRHSPFKESPFKSFAHLTCGFTSRCISLHFRHRLYF